MVAELNEPVYVTIDGKRRKITKREAIVTQMVNESAKANLRATKMLFDMMKEVEQKAGDAPPEPAKLTATDKEVVELFRRACAARSRRRPPRLPRPPPPINRVDHAGRDRRGDTALAEHAALLRDDFASFAAYCFRELNPRTRFAMNWHVEVIARKLMAVPEGGSGG
jgi:hypothetical protein